jgi:hypothetical protein
LRQVEQRDARSRLSMDGDGRENSTSRNRHESQGMTPLKPHSDGLFHGCIGFEGLSPCPQVPLRKLYLHPSPLLPSFLSTSAALAFR